MRRRIAHFDEKFVVCFYSLVEVIPISSELVSQWYSIFQIAVYCLLILWSSCTFKFPGDEKAMRACVWVALNSILTNKALVNDHPVLQLRILSMDISEAYLSICVINSVEFLDVNSDWLRNFWCLMAREATSVKFTCDSINVPNFIGETSFGWQSHRWFAAREKPHSSTATTDFRNRTKGGRNMAEIMATATTWDRMSPNRIDFEDVNN